MRLLAFVIFFLSGFAALVYQVIWQRLLVVFSGADVYSATVVVVAFMIGLGGGSLAGGHIGDRVSRTTSLVLFAGAELGIGLFGLQSTVILYDGLYEQLGHYGAQPALMAGLLVATLLLPTCLMGASLPLLVRAITRSIDGAASAAGWLYGGNTLGAALGALCTIWWFVPRSGLEGALGVAARINFACVAAIVPVLAVLYFTRARASAGGPTSAAVPSTSGPEPQAVVFRYRQWVALYALSGFLALALEIVWFRLLGVMLKSTAFTFGTLLAQYLFWLGVGSLIGSVLASRVRRPALGFLAAQTMATVYAGVSLSVLANRIARAPSMDWFREYLGGYEPMNVIEPASDVRSFINAAIWSEPRLDMLPLDFLWLYFVLPALLIGPSTLLMGMSFPLLQRVVQTDLAYVSRRVGVILVANIVGSAAGAILTSWLFLTWLGTSGTLRLLVALSAVFPLLAAMRLVASPRRRSAAFAVTACASLVVVITIPGAETLWARLHTTTAQGIVFAEDGSGLAVLKAHGSGLENGVDVYVNGLGQSRIPYANSTQTLLGALPAMIHPHPQEAAIVGLGSGNTLAALAGRPELRRITSIEIIQPLLQTLRRLAPVIDYGGLHAILDDPRIEHVFGDGRFFIKHSSRRFDIIEADALRPGSAYSGTLYSAEYFELLRSRLAPGGLAVTWVPTDRVETTFLTVFPHVLILDRVFIGSNEPIDFDPEAVLRRLQEPAIAHHYQRLGIDIEGVLRPVVRSAQMPDRSGLDMTDVITDLHPRDEFGIPAMFDLSLLRPEGER